MIDVENEIFNEISTVLKSAFTKISVKSEYVVSPSSYPCVSIEETDNYVNVNSQDSASTENYANVMYEVNIYTSKTNGKKTQCKEIFAVLDNKFNSLGFTRTMRQPVSTDDAKSYRLTARYTAVVSANKYIFRR